MYSAAADHVVSAPAPVPPSVPFETRLGFEFRGSAAEYFRIWIVNLALTVATAGIYSAWAKVRRLKYLYGHTHLADSAFGYHGDPRKILKGRAIATVFLIAYGAAGRIHPLAGALAAVALGLATPWLIVKSLRFSMRMTSWRGLRFDFDEDYRESYRIFLGWGALAMLSLGVLLPVFLQRRLKFAVDHTAYGSTHFECDPPLKPIYLAALRAALVAVGLVVPLMLAFVGVIGWLAASGSVPATDDPSTLLTLIPLGIAIVTYLGAFAFFNAGLLNTVYGSTRLGPHRLHSQLQGRRLAWLYFSNTVAIVATLGLLVPWATIRTLRYRLDTLSVTAMGSLDELAAGEANAAPGATGEEIADFFDVDFGL